MQGKERDRRVKKDNMDNRGRWEVNFVRSLLIYKLLPVGKNILRGTEKGYFFWNKYTGPNFLGLDSETSYGSVLIPVSV
jgi:hypothetical protein